MKKTIFCSLLINILLVCFFLLINTLAFSIPQGWMEDNVRQSEKEFQVMEIPTIYFIFHYWMTHRNWSVSYFAFMSCLYVMSKQSNRTET